MIDISQERREGPRACLVGELWNRHVADAEVKFEELQRSAVVDPKFH